MKNMLVVTLMLVFSALLPACQRAIPTPGIAAMPTLPATSADANMQAQKIEQQKTINQLEKNQ